MEDKMMKDHPEGCKCMMCEGGKCSVCNGHHCSGCGCMCHHWGGRHIILRLVLGIIILTVVFCAGVKLGELRVMYGGGGYFGYYPSRSAMMGGGYNYGMMNPYLYNQQGMMGQLNTKNSTSTSH